jgi:hypothetical protein
VSDEPRQPDEDEDARDDTSVCPPLAEPESIPIGIPISPAEYRELKERAKHGHEKEEGGD